LETLGQPLEAGQAQRRGKNDERTWRTVGDGERDATLNAILLQPDHALALSLAPRRDSD
jgi:hypothetical protein